MHASILIKNGRCMTMEGKEIKKWIAVEQNKIVAMGDNTEYESLIDRDTIVFDAGGNTVFPDLSTVIFMDSST